MSINVIQCFPAFSNLQNTSKIPHSQGGSFPTEPGWLGLRELCTDPWLPSAFCFFEMNCGAVFWCFSACFMFFVDFFVCKVCLFFREGWRDDMFRMIHGRNKFKAHSGMLTHGCKIKTFFWKEKTLFHICSKAQTEQNKSKATKLSTD